MTIQELQGHLLRLSASDRWQLVRLLLDSLRQETSQKAPRRGNLSRLRGIAKVTSAEQTTDDYATYLTEKYQ